MNIFVFRCFWELYCGATLKRTTKTRYLLVSTVDLSCLILKAYVRSYFGFQEGVTDADVYPDIQFTLTYQIVKEPTPNVSDPTDVPSLVPFAVFDPLKPQQATAVVRNLLLFGSWTTSLDEGRSYWVFWGQEKLQDWRKY